MTFESLSEKEKLVMKLLEDNKSYPEIAKEAHVSFSFISSVNKKRLGKNPTVKKQLSIPTQALQLFSEGKSVIEAIIILDRPYIEICKYHDEYLRLKNRGYLVLFIEVYQDTLPIIKVIKYLIQNPSSKNEIIATLALVKDISKLKSTKKKLHEKIQRLCETRNYLLNDIHDIRQMN